MFGFLKAVQGNAERAIGHRMGGVRTRVYCQTLDVISGAGWDNKDKKGYAVGALCA